MTIIVNEEVFLAFSQSRYIRNTSDIPPNLGVYPNLISDVNKLSAHCGQGRSLYGRENLFR